MIKTINATKFRNNYKATMDHLKRSKEAVVITDRNVPTAVLLDIDTYEDVVSGKNKKFVASIKRARAQYARGDVLSMEEVFSGLI